MAHLQYAVVTVCSWYPQNLQVCQVGVTPSNVDDMIAEFTKRYYLCFSSKYASEFRKAINRTLMRVVKGSHVQFSSEY